MNLYLSQRGRVVALILAVLLVFGAIVGIWLWEHSSSEGDPSYDGDVVFEHRGVKYRVRDGMETVLVIGVDKYGDNVSSGSYNNDKRADFLSLLIIDHKAKSYHTLQINRDTMAEICVLGVGGQQVGTVREQIALSHTYGSGLEDSCRNTRRAVSGLLFDIPIDSYVSMTMDAVGRINDMVGGVTLTVKDDLSVFDSAMTAGVELTLTGEQALIYVRYRSGLADSSNAARMARQRQYLNALFAQCREYLTENDGFDTEEQKALADLLVTDLSSAKTEDLFDLLRDYEQGDVVAMEGELVEREHMEFYPDESSLKEILIELMCEPKK